MQYQCILNLKLNKSLSDNVLDFEKFVSGRSTFFERQQQMVQQPTPATPSNMSFALITVPEGATVTRCPAATGNDSDDVSLGHTHLFLKASLLLKVGVLWEERDEPFCEMILFIQHKRLQTPYVAMLCV